MAYVMNDGGKAATGRKGKSGDCAVRAVAIATGTDYETAYRMMADEAASFGYKKSARDGIHMDVITSVLKKFGWAWVAAPKISGRKARCVDLAEKGTVIARQAKHFVAVIDGTPHDIFDCSDRMVYGCWAKA
jgi:hypothetical protein